MRYYVWFLVTGWIVFGLQTTVRSQVPSLMPFSREAPTVAQTPLAYYNGPSKRYLFDTGQAVAKVKPAVGLKSFSTRPEVLAPAVGDVLADLRNTFEDIGLAVVRTRGRQAISLQPASRPAAVEYVLPILAESTKPMVPGKLDGRPATPLIVMTPRISAQFTSAMFVGAQTAAARRTAVDHYIARFGLKIQTQADKPLSVPFTYSLTLVGNEVSAVRIIEAANRLYEQGSAAGLVVYAKPDFIRPKRRAQLPIQDPRFPNQWHLNNTGQGDPAFPGLPDADVDAPEAWAITEGVPEVRIAIIDDSVQKSHPDLKDNYVTGRHYVDSTNSYDSDPSPRKFDQQHGTACAGVAVGVANGIGVRGIAPRCGLIGIHIFDGNSDLQTADAFYFAADPDGDPATNDGAAVISCSWSLNREDVPIEIATAITDVTQSGRGGKGVVVLFAAGNDYDEVKYHQGLAASDEVICVGATNYRDVRSQYSNYGPELDVVAPSNDPDSGALAIDTTDNTDDQVRLPNADRSGYAIGDYTGTASARGFGGTSSATPLAAGTCGLILSANPELTAAQVRAILEHTCDRVTGISNDSLAAEYNPATGHDDQYGFGRVNAARAVRAAFAAKSDPGSIWPARVRDLTVTKVSSESLRLQWRNPSQPAAGVVVVQSASPIIWRPYDGERYAVGDEVDTGARVINIARRVQLDLTIEPTRPTHVAIYAFNNDHRYSWGNAAQMAPSPTPDPMPVP